MSHTDYREFLKRKERIHAPTGFEANVNYPTLFPFQNYVVGKALSFGKYGIFSGTGTGKMRMEIVWCNEVSKHTGKPTLILCPLAVAYQIIEEGVKIGIRVTRASLDKENPHFAPIQIANYEQLENIDASAYAGIALDESSILKHHEGAYRNLLIDTFRTTPYKSVWTATPSPNDPMEIGNYSEFLDILNRSQMLATYFVHDGGETAKWRIKGHAVDLFWKWVSTWAVMFEKPHDIGFPMQGYELPPLNFFERQIITETKEGRMFNDVAVSATNFNQELRLTKVERLEEIKTIIGESQEQFLIWIKQNEEGEYLRRLFRHGIEVKGSDSLEWKESKLAGFAHGEFPLLWTKGKIAGMGQNFQSCHNQVFPSVDFSFEMLFQQIRRSWRYGQKHPVNIYIVTTDTMQNVIQSIKKKEKQHQEMVRQMIKHFNQQNHGR